MIVINSMISMLNRGNKIQIQRNIDDSAESVPCVAL